MESSRIPPLPDSHSPTPRAVPFCRLPSGTGCQVTCGAPFFLDVVWRVWQCGQISQNDTRCGWGTLWCLRAESCSCGIEVGGGQRHLGLSSRCTIVVKSEYKVYWGKNWPYLDRVRGLGSWLGAMGRVGLVLGLGELELGLGLGYCWVRVNVGLEQGCQTYCPGAGTSPQGGSTRPAG